jgi:hypothetical protein
MATGGSELSSDGHDSGVGERCSVGHDATEPSDRDTEGSEAVEVLLEP